MNTKLSEPQKQGNKRMEVHLILLWIMEVTEVKKFSLIEFILGNKDNEVLVLLSHTSSHNFIITKLYLS